MVCESPSSAGYAGTTGYFPTYVTVGIFAWNEESGIALMLQTLFRQSLFAELRERNLTCEIICVANGCTDQTVSLATEAIDAQKRGHPQTASFNARVAEITRRGKANAWNEFVHSFSSREAQFLFMMDADIVLDDPDTLWKLLTVLEADPHASATVDRPCKDITRKLRKNLWDRLSLGSSLMTQSSEAQLCGQLYCIKASVARAIYLPRDLAACEDGFIKALVCTDLLTGPCVPDRLRVVPEAGHYFAAYTTPAAVIRNQKRQIIGQTLVHILIDECLIHRPPSAWGRLGEWIRERDRMDPAWLKRLIWDHLQRTRWWWRLYPGMIDSPFRRLRKVGGIKRLKCVPAAIARCVLALVSGFLAFRSLRTGCMDYWPHSRPAKTD